jgi:protein involved in polysaccharide export with SLBB domain
MKILATFILSIVLPLLAVATTEITVPQEVKELQETKEMTLPTQKENIESVSIQDKLKEQTIFGENLFDGKFSTNRQYRYNPDYLINIGDEIRLKLWGAYDFEGIFTVDTQGNIFVPKVGVIHLAGIKNNEITSIIKKEINKVFKNNVYIYADLKEYQNISVFVTGSVQNPGLYEGLSSDSIIQFLDKANGIDTLYGSYRNIKIIRNNNLIKKIDLYDFLLKGYMDLFQFKMGDVILVEHIDQYINVEGDVKRPYRFELDRKSIQVKDIVKQAVPHPNVTNFVVVSKGFDHKQNSKQYKLRDNYELHIHSGETIRFLTDHNIKTFEVQIEGEHGGLHRKIVTKGTTLKDLIPTLSFTDLSDQNSIQLFRKSIADNQKQLIDSGLRDLEANILKRSSATKDGALIKKEEAVLIQNFIERAREVEPKGRVVINKDTDITNIYLEENDIIYIPKKSYMVTIQGEVKLPGAQTYVEKMDISEYISSCGGYSIRADKENVLVIKPNGMTFTYDNGSFSSEPTIEPGDSILILGQVDSESLQITKDITQILYQIAVGAGVVLRAF